MLYNNIDMSNRIRIINIRGRGLADQELVTVRAAGSNEDFVNKRTSPSRYIEVEYEIRADDKESLRKKIDEVSPLFITNGWVPVVFPDEKDRTYYVEYDGAEENIERHHIGVHRGTIFLLRRHKFGKEHQIIALKKFTWEQYQGQTWEEIINGNDNS